MLKKRLIPLLIAVNVCAGAAVGLSFLPETEAHAQGFGGAQYSMISASSTVRNNQDLIFITDMQNGKVGAFAHDGDEATMMGSRDIAEDLSGNDANGRRGGRR